MNKVRISVLLPVFNGQKYIHEAIQSILNQSFREFELLIIDDGSTDDTVQIIQSYHDSRINLIQNDSNIGLIKTLNRGIKFAKGEYLARMDADDISVPSRLKNQIEFMDNHPEIMVCGCWMYNFGAEKGAVRYAPDHNTICANLLFFSSIPHAATMIRLEPFRKLNFSFNEEAPHIEDYELWSRVYREGKFYNIQKVLYLRRLHETNISTLNRETTQKIRQRIRKKMLLEIFNDLSEEELRIHGLTSETPTYLNPADKIKLKAWIKKLFDGIQNRWGPVNRIRLYFMMGRYFSSLPFCTEWHGKPYWRIRCLWPIHRRMALSFLIGTLLKWT